MPSSQGVGELYAVVGAGHSFVTCIIYLSCTRVLSSCLERMWPTLVSHYCILSWPRLYITFNSLKMETGIPFLFFLLSD